MNWYFCEDDESNTENHTCVDSSGETMEDTADWVDHFPEREVDESSKSNNVAELTHFIIWSQHGQVKAAQNGDSINSKVRGRDKETDKSRYNDGDEADWLLTEWHDGVCYWDCVGEQSDWDDEVETPLYFIESVIFWLFNIAIHLSFKLL